MNNLGVKVCSLLLECRLCPLRTKFMEACGGLAGCMIIFDRGHLSRTNAVSFILLHPGPASMLLPPDIGVMVIWVGILSLRAAT